MIETHAIEQLATDQWLGLKLAGFMENSSMMQSQVSTGL